MWQQLIMTLTQDMLAPCWQALYLTQHCSFPGNPVDTQVLLDACSQSHPLERLHSMTQSSTLNQCTKITYLQLRCSMFFQQLLAKVLVGQAVFDGSQSTAVNTSPYSRRYPSRARILKHREVTSFTRSA